MKNRILSGLLISLTFLILILIYYAYDTKPTPNYLPAYTSNYKTYTFGETYNIPFTTKVKDIHDAEVILVNLEDKSVINDKKMSSNLKKAYNKNKPLVFVNIDNKLNENEIIKLYGEDSIFRTRSNDGDFKFYMYIAKKQNETPSSKSFITTSSKLEFYQVNDEIYKALNELQ